MPHPKQLVATIDAYLEALAAGNLEAVLALYAPDATVEDPVGSEVVRGGDALRAFYERAVAQRIVPERVGKVRVAGAEAAYVMKLTIPDHGMTIDLIETLAFDDDGRITAMRAYWGGGNISR